MKDREYLFNYRFAGAEYGVTIHASSPEEAREKIKQVALARYEGEVAMKIPVPLPQTMVGIVMSWFKR